MKILSKKEYNTIHVWVLRHYKKTGVCENCRESKKTEWSNKTGNYDRHNRLEWQELCKQCHYLYDTTVLGKPTYKEMGAAGGKKSTTGGFAANRELARTAGIKGGTISKRGPAKK